MRRTAGTMPEADQIERFLEEIYSRGTVPDENGNQREIFPTGMRREQGRAISMLVERERAERTTETGFALGLSGLWIALGLIRSGAADPRHIAIDPGQGKIFGGAGRMAFKEAGLEAMLTLDERRSELVLPELILGESPLFDLALVDGSHLFEHVMIDLFYLSRLVHPGGLVIVDDTWMPSVRAAVDYFVRNTGMILEAPFRRKRSFSARLIGPRYEYEPMALLRIPDPPPRRAWDSFVPMDWR